MASDENSRIDNFWRWIQRNAEVLRRDILTAEEKRDFEKLDMIASFTYEQIATVSEELVVDLHIDPAEICLAVRTGLPDKSLVDRVLARAPRLPGWRFAREIPQDFDRVIARDETGREIAVPYAALTFAITEGAPGEKHSILIVFDGDFDTGGRERSLYEDVATHVLTTFIGRIPSTIGSYRLVPVRLARGVPTRPIVELSTAWARIAQGS
jgi:hypothetical protein